MQTENSKNTNTKRRVLCICSSFRPGKSPSAIKVSGMLEPLVDKYEFDIVTSQISPSLEGANCHYVAPRDTTKLQNTLNRFKLHRLYSLFTWPDYGIYWIFRAFKYIRQNLKQHRYDAVCIFVMPYSAALLANPLKKLFSCPVMVTFSDSPTCDGIHVEYETIIHKFLARWLENKIIKSADWVNYVSEENMNRVRNRFSSFIQRQKIHLLRRGGDKEFANIKNNTNNNEPFRIVYAGGMTGWLKIYQDHESPSKFQLFLRKINAIGKYRPFAINVRGHSPLYLGRAIVKLMKDDPTLLGKIKVQIVGNSFGQNIIDYVLKKEGFTDFMSVEPPVAHKEIPNILGKADALFMCLNAFPPNVSNGIISCKTYEYLLTSKPIIAALPQGENRRFLSHHKGVWASDPDDVENISLALKELIYPYLAGELPLFERSENLHTMTYEVRSQEFSRQLEDLLNHQN